MLLCYYNTKALVVHNVNLKESHSVKLTECSFKYSASQIKENQINFLADNTEFT